MHAPNINKQAIKLLASNIELIPTPDKIWAKKLIVKISDQIKKVKEWGRILFLKIAKRYITVAVIFEPTDSTSKIFAKIIDFRLQVVAESCSEWCRRRRLCCCSLYL